MASNRRTLKIFTGNANPQMAQAIASELDVEMGKATIGTFADGETSVSIGETVRGCDVFVIQSTCNPVNDSLMELLIMIDAFRRASAHRITAVVPYYGYARQDRKVKARDPISSKLVADIITAAGADRVLTIDLHAQQLQGFFNIPLDHLVGSPLFVDYFCHHFEQNRGDVTIVAPDLGSVARTRAFAEKFNAPLAIIDKRRPEANQSEVVHIIGDVKDRRCVIIDDMIDTAGTLCNAATALVEVGGATEVIAAATHAVLSDPAIERLEKSYISQVAVLDTIPLRENARNCKKIVKLSAAPLFAQAIRHIHEELPVSPLFD